MATVRAEGFILTLSKTEATKLLPAIRDVDGLWGLYLALGEALREGRSTADAEGV